MKRLKAFFRLMISRSIAAEISILDVQHGDILLLKVADGVDHGRVHEIMDGVLARAKINGVQVVVGDSKTEFTVVHNYSTFDAITGRLEALEKIAARQGVTYGTRGGNPGGAGGDPGSGD